MQVKIDGMRRHDDDTPGVSTLGTNSSGATGDQTSPNRLECARVPAKDRSDVLFSFAWITVATLFIDFGDFHRSHNADSLVPILQSLYKWEPYYWEQNRYGMFVALLAIPFHNPLTNLLVQNGITIWCGLACFPLLARYFCVSREWGTIGIVAASSFIAVAPTQLQWMFLSTFNVFSTSLALGLLGLIALEKPSWQRGVYAAIAIGLAAWINSSIGILLLFVVLGVGLARQITIHLSSNKSGTWYYKSLPQLLLCIVAAAFGYGLGKMSPREYQTTWIVVPEIRDWWPLVMSMLRELNGELTLTYWLSFFAVCVVTLWIAIINSLKISRGVAVQFLAVLIATVAYSCAMGILFKGRWRYATPAMIVAHVAAITAVFGAWNIRQLPFKVALPILLILPIISRYGSPSLARVELDLRTKFEIGYNEIYQAQCTHVAGSFWKVWPAVFASNWHEFERGADRTIWGVSFRSKPTSEFWKAVPREQTRVAAFVDDPESDQYLKLLGDDWRVERTQGLIVIFVPK